MVGWGRNRVKIWVFDSRTDKNSLELVMRLLFPSSRQDMMQRQNTDEKQFRNCVAHEMARERYRQAKAKVEAIKQPRQMALYSLPVIGSSGTAVPVIEYDG